jgi:2,3-bisphosphoglycerate-independent phosphoglycerate mutase
MTTFNKEDLHPRTVQIINEFMQRVEQAIKENKVAEAEEQEIINAVLIVFVAETARRLEILEGVVQP